MTTLAPGYQYRAEWLRVIDGDTLELRVDLGFDVRVDIHIRIAGIDAPERNTPTGPAARDALHRLVTGRQLHIKTHKTRSGSDVRSFVRYVADVHALDGAGGPPTNVADAMIASGHALARLPAP